MLLDLQRFVAGDAAGAHKHLEKYIADGEGVGLGGKGGEGGVGDVVRLGE